MSAAPLIRTGDRVRLLSGGPWMEVAALRAPDCIICVWTDANGERWRRLVGYEYVDGQFLASAFSPRLDN